MQDYLSVLRKYGRFSGRSRRREFWMFTLVTLVTAFALGLLDVLLFRDAVFSDGTGVLFNLYWLATLIPGLALTVRRLHDTGRSGWYLLFSLVPLAGAVLLLIYTTNDSTVGTNKWGLNPKEGTHPDDQPRG